MGRKKNRNKGARAAATEQHSVVGGVVNSQKRGMKRTMRIPKPKCPMQIGAADLTLQPIQQDGETVLEIECGPNKAILYTSKLRQGSKGSCVSFQGSWLTPNEFQFVSGRETAKDWKRSIRHAGKSLKLLLDKGLFDDLQTGLVRSKKQDDSDTAGEAEVKGSDENMSPAKPLVPKFKIRKRKKGRRPKRTKDSAAKQTTKAACPLGTLDIQDENTTEYEASEPTGPAEEEEEAEKQEEAIDAIDHDDDHDDDDEKEEDTGDQGTPTEEEDKPFVEEIVNESQTETTETRDDNDDDDDDDKVEDVEEEAEEKIIPGSPEVVTSLESPTETKPQVELEPETQAIPEILTTLGLSARSRPIETQEQVCTELPVIEKPLDATTAKSDDVTVADEREEDNDDDPEMPTLQKEGDIVGPEVPLSGSVTPFHAAVTPPPTPPSTSPVISDIKKPLEDEKPPVALPEVSLSDHVELTIEHSPAEEEKPACKKRTDIQTLLLQDALESARKYKEQLHKKQAIKKLSTETAPSPVKKEHSIAHPVKHPHSAYHVDKKPKINPIPLNSSHKQHPEIPQKFSPTNGVTSYVDRRSTKQILSESYKMKEHALPSMTSPAQKHSRETRDHHRSTPTSYGSLLSQLDSKMGMYPAAMFPTFPGFPYKDLKLGSKHGPLEQEPLPMIPFSMVPSAMALGMPTQFSNIYPSATFPGSFKLEKPRDSPRDSPRASPRDSPREAPSDMSSKKRKQPSGDEKALDLSVKKTKFTSATPSVYGGDAPLDFSVKNYSKQGGKLSESLKRTDNHVTVSSAQSPLHYPSKSADRHSSHTWADKTHLSGNRVRHDICTCSENANDIRNWSVDRVCRFLTVLDGCAQYIKTFREQGINGRLLPFLTTQHLTRTLGMKVGPALTLMQAVERKFRESSASVPCHFCRLRAPIPIHM